MKPVKAIFDIGKTNKKFLLFDNNYKVVFEKEKNFNEAEDDDGFACENIKALKEWITTSLRKIISDSDYHISQLNFSTYGATLVYLDEKGNRVAPIYNYLKPVDKSYFDEFYEKYEGEEEFCRKTASPPLGMLNSSLQIYWLQNEKPEYWDKTKYILHFPQYLSYLFTREIVSEYTSIGCHTGMWNFDKMKYHSWLKEEGIKLPKPIGNRESFKVEIGGQKIDVGIGIHDSSASLVPFFEAADEPFILISSGTWAINLNPFNDNNLTTEQLQNDCLCYLSVNQKQVMASRLFLGHIHEVNTKLLSQHFNKPEDRYKNIESDGKRIDKIFESSKLIFFKQGIPENYKLDQSKLDEFQNYRHAYHQLMFELCYFEVEQIKRIMQSNRNIQKLFIAGGFVHNKLFTDYLHRFFPDMEIETSELKNSTALGAAMVLDM